MTMRGTDQTAWGPSAIANQHTLSLSLASRAVKSPGWKCGAALRCKIPNGGLEAPLFSQADRKRSRWSSQSRPDRTEQGPIGPGSIAVPSWTPLEN